MQIERLEPVLCNREVYPRKVKKRPQNANLCTVFRAIERSIKSINNFLWKRALKAHSNRKLLIQIHFKRFNSLAKLVGNY